jgi:hypothetical protein
VRDNCLADQKDFGPSGYAMTFPLFGKAIRQNGATTKKRLSKYGIDASRRGCAGDVIQAIGRARPGRDGLHPWEPTFPVVAVRRHGEESAVFDEVQMLREKSDLQRLLSHYADAGEADREAWQDRLMMLEGTDRNELAKLHGLLIAFGWVDQNTGNTTVRAPGTVAACYRVTPAGLRARKAAQIASGEPEMVESIACCTEETPEPKRREWRKEKQARSKQAANNQAEAPPVATAELVPVLV